MKTNPFLIALVASLIAFPAVAAEKEKETKQKSGPIDYPFWNAKKRADAPQFVPGLNAALQLTPGQEEKIDAARSELNNDEGLKPYRSLAKGDPSVTEEQRQKAREAIDAANAKLREKVKSILTPEQNALIAKINKAYEETGDEIGAIYADKFAVKGDEAARKRVMEEKNQDTIDRFLSKLDTLLTPAQKEAMTRAGEIEKQQNAKAAAAASAKKPSK